MQPDSTTASNEATTPHLPRMKELEEFAGILPIRGVEAASNRVFNIWGEVGIGKSTFVSQFRESEAMLKAKLLWIQPTRDEPLDTIPEFIRACAKTVRYPSDPKKEKRISEQLESVERGKVNPIVSDDSLLITRSKIANQKRAYINQAAASSVGRTESVRDDIEINVGLGESKANNHAEGFLDALPLQSLGTDLTIIYIEHFGRLSVAIVDWLRDYVFPAATKGAYRRSLIFLIESTDPIHLAYPNENWGDWDKHLEDYRLNPLSEKDILEIGLSHGLETSEAKFLNYKSLGYPAVAIQAIPNLKSLNRTSPARFLDSLPEADQLKVAILSLPESIHAEDLDILFGHKQGNHTLEWFKQLPDNQSTQSHSGKIICLSDALRCEALSRFSNNSKLHDFAQKWAPMGRLMRNVPSRTDRSKLLLLSGVFWIDSAFCENLFGEQAEKILPFTTGNPLIFNRLQTRYRVSERLRPDLQQAARLLNHPGLNNIHRKATEIWTSKQDELSARIVEIENELRANQDQIDSLLRHQNEINAQFRIQERADSEEEIEHSSTLANLLPKWLKFGLSTENDPNSPEQLKLHSKELSHKVYEIESKSDELRSTLETIRKALTYPYV